MTNRKWKDGKQQPSMLLGSAVPGSSLVSSYFLWAILCPQSVTVELLVAAADGATDLRMGHDRLCMRLQVKWGNVPEMAAVGSDCCIHFLLYLWEGSMYTASFMKEQN